MNKKVQKGLVAAVAATMGASVVAPTAFAASQTQNVSLDAQYAEAYTATAKALESKTQKDLTAARVLVDNLYNTVKGTANEFLATTLSSILDPAQQVKLVAFFDAMEKAEVSGKQADINAAQELIIDMPQVWRNSYSTAMDTIQQKLIDKVVEATKKAQASASDADKAAAQALLDEVKTVTNNDGVANWAKAYQATIDAVVTVARVESVKAVNQKMIQVKFNKEVDYTTSLTPSNYTIDGVKLSTISGAYGVLASDQKSVDIYLPTALAQDSKVTVGVSGVLQDSTYTALADYSETVTIKDTTNPTLVSATLKNGNKDLYLTFSEAIESTNVASYDSYTLNGQSLTTFGAALPAYQTTTWTTTGVSQNKTNVVKISFASKLADGSYTVAVKNGKLADVAGFYTVDQKATFNAQANNDALQVVSTTANAGNPGKIEVKFNKAIDAPVSGYDVNDSGSTVTPSRKAGTLDTIVISTKQVKEGANIVTIPGNQRDSFGNKLGENNLRVSVQGVKDTVKPAVEKVFALTDKKVRVKFSESVNVEPFVSAKANWTIKDADGVIYSSTVNPGGYTITPSADGEANLVDIDFANALPGSNYTLEIKGVKDGSGNEMDAYTTAFVSPDKTAPTLATGNNLVVNSANNSVEIFFSEPMAASSLTDKSNFMYETKSALGSYNTLPLSVTIEPAANNRSVKITFPGTIAVSTSTINTFKVLNVKDAAGNNFANGTGITAVGTTNRGVAPSVVAGSAIATADSDKVVVTFNTDQQLVKINKANFANFLTGTPVTGSINGAAPDNATVAGKTVTLTYNNTNADFAAIKSAGKTLSLANSFTATNAENAYGDVLTTTGLSATDRLVADKILPELVATTPINVTGANTITVTFNEKISDENQSEVKDDFVITTNGSYTTIDSVATSASNTLTLTTKDALSGTITLSLAPEKISIKDLSANVYAPTSANKNLWTATLAQSTKATIKGALTTPGLTDAIVQGLGDCRTVAATSANLVGGAVLVPTTDLSTINAGTTVEFVVDGNTYTISNAALIAAFGTGKVNADVKAAVENAVVLGAPSMKLSAVADITVNAGGKIEVKSKTTGVSSIVTFNINDGATDTAAIQTAFGLTDAATIAGAASNSTANKTLAFDGKTVTLDENYSAMTVAQFVTALNAKLVSGTVGYTVTTDGGQLVLTKDVAGSTTGLALTGTAATALFGTAVVTNGTGAGSTGAFAQ